MLLATAICFGFVIEMCSAATNGPDLFDGVFVCVEKDPKSNATIVTWTLAASIHATCCDLVYSENKTSSESIVEPSLPPTGTFQLTNLRNSVVHIIQMTCLVSCDGRTTASKSYRPSQVSFLSGPTAGKVCSTAQPLNLSHGQISVCMYKTQGKFNHVVQWTGTQAYRPSSCTLRYTPMGTTETQHRTEIFRDLPMNSSMFLTEGATDVQVKCNNSNNDMLSSGILKYPQNDQEPRVCSVSPNHMLPVTVRTPVTDPTHYLGLHVSSLAQGLALAFSILLVSFLMSMFAYRRYKSYRRRQSQRLLRVESEEEASDEAAMQDFQRMV